MSSPDNPEKALRKPSHLFLFSQLNHLLVTLCAMNSVPLPVANESPIANLDTDVLVDILSHLHPLDLLTVRQVSINIHQWLFYAFVGCEKN